MKCLLDLYVDCIKELAQYAVWAINVPYYDIFQIQYRKVWDYLLQLSSGIDILMFYFRP